jgi:hypothetical protein
MTARFLLIWNDEHDPDRDVRRIADGIADAVRGIHDFLDHSDCYDEERPAGAFYEDSLQPAFQAFLDGIAGDDLAAFLATMPLDEPVKLACEDGTFEIVRDR